MTSRRMLSSDESWTLDPKIELFVSSGYRITQQ